MYVGVAGEDKVAVVDVKTMKLVTKDDTVPDHHDR